MAIAVYRYGVRYKWAVPEPLCEQLFLAHGLREDLVSLQHGHEHAARDIWSSYTAVAATEQQVAVSEAAAVAVGEQVAKQRGSGQHMTRTAGPAADALKTARAAARTARQARRDAIVAVREDASERTADLQQRLRAAEKAFYADYCQTRGLYWATFNDILDHHKTTVKRIQKDRAAGRPAALQHHNFDGSGTVTVQLQREAGQPQRTPAIIADAEQGKWRNVFHLPWTDPAEWKSMTRAEQRNAGRLTARMRCGQGCIEVPVQAHRMLPAVTDITGARLTVRRVAGGTRCHLTITAKHPDPPQVTDGPAVALHLGWRNSDHATIVATWRASLPLNIPVEARHLLRPNFGHLTGKVQVPHQVAERHAAINQIRAGRDNALKEAKSVLMKWLSDHGPTPDPDRDGETITAGDVARWRSPSRFARLARQWRDNPPPYGENIAATLENWRRHDRAQWERQEHGRRKVLSHRDDLYRKVAAIIADQVSVLVVDDMNMLRIAREETDLPGEMRRRVAHRRHVAAPGRLRETVAAACIRDGIPVRTVTAVGLSRIHARCGYENPADDRYRSRPVLCDGCGATYDPDSSATVLMLTRAGHQTTQTDSA